MGKFLKILRYIANLIATMGASTSTPTPTPAHFSINSPPSSEEPSDFLPEGSVWDEKPIIDIKNIIQYKDKQTEYDKCFPHGTHCDGSPHFIGSGRILSSYPNGAGILKRVKFHDSSCLQHVSIFCTTNGFVMEVNGILFGLPNFLSFLKGDEGISTGDFFDGIVAEQPANYNMIWEILDSSRKYTATYHTSLFDAPLRRLKKGRDDITGDIFCFSTGQSQLKLLSNHKEHDIKEILFRNGRKTVAKILFKSAWNIFQRDTTLFIGDEKYTLPNYISVLSGVITEEQFIEELYRRYSESEIERILEFITNKTLLRCSIY